VSEQTRKTKKKAGQEDELKAEIDAMFETEKPAENGFYEHEAADGKADGETRLELELKSIRLELEIRKLEAEAARRHAEAYQAQMRKMAGEFENYRRRTEENAKKLRDDGVIEAVLGLINVFDTIKIAIGMMEDEAAKSGMNMVLKQFKSGLASLGVEEIEAEGCPFDPAFHDAVLSEPAKGAESGTVLQVMNEGFVINGRVVRHASVKIAS